MRNWRRSSAIRRTAGGCAKRGLWRYSRHPNYFFEWFIWVAWMVYALASPWGWLSVVCPALDAVLPVPGHRNSGDRGAGAALARGRVCAVSADHQRVCSVVPEVAAIKLNRAFYEHNYFHQTEPCRGSRLRTDQRPGLIAGARSAARLADSHRHSAAAGAAPARGRSGRRGRQRCAPDGVRRAAQGESGGDRHRGRQSAALRSPGAILRAGAWAST